MWSTTGRKFKPLIFKIFFLVFECILEFGITMMSAMPEAIVWKNSPIKTDVGDMQRVHIGEKQAEKKPTLLQKLGYKANMTREEFSTFLETATTLFDDDESPMKTKPSQNPKIAKETQSQYELLFASPNESFQAVPYHYDEEEEEEVEPGMIHIMDESMLEDTPAAELSTHLNEDDIDYINIIKRITNNNNKSNSGIPHPYAPSEIRHPEEDFDDCQISQPSLHQYVEGVNVASSIDSNTSFVREIRAKPNPMSSSRDFDANSISFGGDFLQAVAHYASEADLSTDTIDLPSIVAKNRAIASNKGAVSEAQKYLDKHAPRNPKGTLSVLNRKISQQAVIESQNDLMASMDDDLRHRWDYLVKSHDSIVQFKKRGVAIDNFEDSIQLQLNRLLLLSPDVLQNVVFTQHDNLVQDGIFSSEDIM